MMLKLTSDFVMIWHGTSMHIDGRVNELSWLANNDALAGRGVE